jgi:hypothetical protein
MKSGESKGTHGSLWLKPYELVCNALMLLHRKPGALTLKPERSNNSLKIFLRILSELGLYCLSTDSRELFVLLEKEALQHILMSVCIYCPISLPNRRPHLNQVGYFCLKFILFLLERKYLVPNSCCYRGLGPTSEELNPFNQDISKGYLSIIMGS